MTEGLERTDKYPDIHAPVWVVHSVRDADVVAVQFDDDLYRVTAFIRQGNNTKYADRAMQYKIVTSQERLHQVADEYKQRLLTEHIEI